MPDCNRFSGLKEFLQSRKCGRLPSGSGNPLLRPFSRLQVPCIYFTLHEQRPLRPASQHGMKPWDAARKLLNDRSLTARNAWGSRMGAVQWWGDGKADSDYAAGETGGGSLSGQRTGQVEQLPSAVF